ncbi:dynein axonemal heavy chain 2 [Stomoxys calcitrans]|uniref:dynein axonemal heavy chain 2 n=1 Tax=Stomoxys calcitrans TaxID=35570 RepID=UPI0027E22F40|nr:dynein axonemal heavy chain 2 [Stomoxys calcitrans]
MAEINAVDGAGDQLEQLSSYCSSSEEDENAKEIIPQTPEIPRPNYSDEELIKLVDYIQRMTMLFALDQRDWREETLDVIRRWLLEVNEPLLTLFYNGNKLTACLGFPVTPVSDLSYFNRTTNHIFTVDGFHDEVNFGTVHEDVDGCLLRVLQLVYAPVFRNYTDWNSNVKSRFAQAMDKLLGYLTNLNSKMAGMTMLYVPYVVQQMARENIAHDREFVKNMESVVVFWTTQIRTLLSDKVLVVPHDLVVPEEEYEFWLYRYEVLLGINTQLAQDDVQSIIMVLRQSRSVYIKQIEALINECRLEMEQANSNIKYLHLLIEPCSQIDKCESPATVPGVLPRIFYFIRYIWLNSPHYNRRDLITNLFRDVSNQIIRFCVSKTDVDTILGGGKSRFGIKMCNMAVDCCLCYKMIYERMSKSLAQQQPQVGWDLDSVLIFNHIDAFMKRLEDLMDICQAMIAFGRLDETEDIPKPRFGGTNGAEFEKTAERVETDFRKTLSLLESDSKNLILDVHKTGWHEEALKYRRTVQGFEETIKRLMDNAFKRACNIEEALEVLHSVLFYSYRSSVRNTYLKMVSEVWLMFSKEMDNTTKDLTDRENLHESWLAYYASRAVGYRINLERLQWLRDRLKNSEWLPSVPECGKVLAKFDGLKKDFDKEMRKAFDDWVHSCGSANLLDRLERKLLVRSKFKKGLLECNIDRSVLDICQQAQTFEQLNFQIPGSIRKLYEKYATLQFMYNSVITVCLNYNRILSALSEEERTLFKALIQTCDRKIAPALFKLTWGGELSDAYIAGCDKHTQRLQESVDIYKRANHQIARICEQICDTPLVKFTLPGAVELATFEANVTAFNRRATDQILSLYNTIIELLYAVFKEFEYVIEDMASEWYTYVNRFDAMMSEAMLICARNSLNNVYSALRSESDISPPPIIIVSIDVQEQKLVLNPTMEAVESLILSMIQRIRKSLESVDRIALKLEMPEELIGPPFAELMDNDSVIAEIQEKIGNEVDYSREEIEKFMDTWTEYKDIWECSEEEFTRRIEDTEQTANVFEDSIESYSSKAEIIAMKEAIVNVYFIMANQTALKNTLMDYIERWQLQNVSLLTKRATARIKIIYRYVKRNEKRICVVPRTLKEAREATELFNRLKDEVPLKQDEFPETLNLFKILDKYEISIAENTRVLVLNLQTTWESYLKKLGEAGDMLDNTKEEFKQNLLLQAEKFRSIMKEFLAEFMLKLPTSSQTNPRIALKYIKVISDKVVACFKFEESLINDLAIFHINQPENLNLKKLNDEVRIIRNIWELILEWQNTWNEWRKENFWKINIDLMEDTAMSLYKEFSALNKKYYPRNWDMLITTTKNLDGFRRTLPLITALKNPCMRHRHWDSVRKLMEVNFDENSPKFTLELIIELDFQAFSEDIQDISNAATMELQIENGIKNIASIWRKQTFEMVLYRNGIYKIKSVDECSQLLEEHMVQISSMKSTRFVEPFAAVVDYWEKTLSYISETLEKVLQVQRQWLYLENIFAGEDIRKQLPTEAERFALITNEFKAIMEYMFEAKTALKATHIKAPPFLLIRFQKMDERLEAIQRALEIYLESKRQLFPRFYFVSNDDLLEILGNNKRPDLVQMHLRKLFDNLVKLELRRVGKGLNRWQALGMYADDGEYVEFLNVVYIDGPSEKWLAMVEAHMFVVMREQLKLTRASLKKFASNREKWLSLWPGQLVNTTCLIQWTTECTRSLIHCKMVDQKKPLRKLKRKQNKILGKLSEMSRKDLSKIMRLKVNTLITVEIHGRDVIERMYKTNCKDVGHFEWFSQLRFYWHKESETCVVRQTNTEHWYGYEYLGNSGRLVITPLTDRCYITLTTALHLYRGGSPKGPAGTGKTETVKDLGKALGMWVIVTNCSEGLDFKSIGKNFSGLAQTGSWGCFDEFNRINIEVLSVVAQQIMSIIAALSAELKEFVFEGQKIKLVPTVGLFITMNPGYAGRTELPDNLKSLFRPISMMVPDNAIIAENTLYSDGFTNTRSLARKVYTLYELAKQQLSKQYHYDFGLRSMVALLRYAGRKRRQLPHASEEEVVYLAMRDMNVARLTANDLPLFNGIMSDIFPGVDVPLIDYSDFKTAIEDELQGNGLQIIPSAIKKVIELYETKNSRHSTMIIGDTNTAKSVTWKCLQGAFGRMHANKKPGWVAVTVHPMNPKALNLAELYGEYNLATGEWLDGVLSSTMRVICADEDPTQKWLLFDGPVDAVWIENMNSVMDDNKILTLVNSERITMPAQVSLLFEVADLAVASPATVSRCGMVYNDYRDWGWRPYVKSWLQRQKPAEYAKYISELFDEYLDKVLSYKHEHCKEIVKTNELNVVISLCSLLEGFATKQNGIVAGDLELLENMSKLWFLFCLVWSVCATVNEEGRLQLDAFIRTLDSSFPIKDTIYDYFVDPMLRCFLPWESKLYDGWKYNEEEPFYKIIVPTVDTVRYEYLVSKLLQDNHPVLMVGNVGTGKTSTAVSVMEACDKTKFTVLSINISAQTTAAGLQESIENRTEKRTKTHFVPIGGKKMICFMDDFNMPAKDVYGSQPPLELIRQWIDYKYWFNRRNQQKIYVTNTLIMAAMGPPGGGRQVISARTLSRFLLINMTFPTEAVIMRIFGTMIRQKLQLFAPEVRELWHHISAATLHLYNDVVAKMLPTPNKSHYLFNLRDISKVFQGLLRANAEVLVRKAQFLRLWIHECFRVFCDRLVDDRDCEWFGNEMNEVMNRHLEVNLHSLCPHRIVPIFGDFMSRQGFYEDLSFEQLRDYINDQMGEYNNFPGMARLNLVFFKEALEHVARIVRVISQPRGHMLNIGIGGSGRQVLVKLAAFILEMGVFQIEVTKKYKTQEFREDLKSLYKVTGVKQRPTIFIFSGEQVVEDTFLEIINNMLSTGEINLFKADEFEELKTELERPAKRAGIQLTTEALYNFFMQNVRDNLHVALAMSPIGDAFRSYIRQYPALINNTTPNWFRLWPQEALLEVASKFLSEFKINVPVPGREDEKHRDSLVVTTEETLQKNVAFTFSVIHSSVTDISQVMLLEVKRQNYVTSLNYLQLVSGFKELLQQKRFDISSSANKLRNGLSKIAETQEKVSVMTEELKVSSEQVKVLTVECEEFIATIEEQKAEATEQKVKVDADAIQIRREEVTCMDLAATAKADLDMVMPMVDAAVRALDALNKKDVAEVKSYGRPPMKIEKVMEAVLILIGKEPTWENAKKVLGEATFLNDLKNFDRDNISDKTLKRIALYTKNPELEPDKVAVVSVACKSLMQWIMAIENYGKVYRIVAPKQEKLDNAMRSLAEKQALLAAARKKLEELNARLAELYRQLNEKTQLLNELRLKEEKLRKQLERAIILVESLSGERERWIETVASLDKQFEKLPGDCLISTAFMSYLGPFDTKYREILLEKWALLIKEKAIPATEELKITAFLADAVTIREWNIQGLPADDFSTENGVIVTRGSRWPLIIDPQMQANTWVKNYEEKNDLKIIDFGQLDYLKTLEMALQNGHPVLLQNVGEHIDQAINPILRKSCTIQAGQKLMKFNDKFCTYNDNFRLYITTKISNPHYPPEISSKTTIVNFALKKDGLQAQLLGIIVRKEKPALEEQKDKLVLTIARNKRTLIDLDNEILRLLNESRGSLLEDDELFATLQQSRLTSTLVKESLSTAEVTELEIDTARQEYQAAAERASILFFVLMDMSKIDPMYVFSLSAYILLFTQSIERSPKHQIVFERIMNINDYHTYAVYKNTCRGLFERHKLLFSIHMAAQILANAGRLVEAEYEFILKGGIVLDKQGQPPNPATNWISEQSWDNITELDKVSGFHGIVDSFEQSDKLWQVWYATTTPETEDLVGEWNDKLSDFQKICVVRCLRADRIQFCLTQFIINALGQRFVEPPVLDLKTTFEESIPQTPLIFVLSAGVDPAQSLLSLAEQVKMSARMFSLSLGQGQAPVATKMIMDGIREGNWVFLANCHLSLSWMPTLDKIIATMQTMKLDRRFRLWLSSSPHPEFPISILQTSIKMTTEPPRGIKANMKRLYSNVNVDNFEAASDPSQYKKLLFSLCFFHTILLERKKFLQLGWNVIYSFNDSDFEVSEVLLLLYLNAYEETPWGALKYLIAGVNYGGHVTDDWDRRLLTTYINQYFCDDAITTRKYRLSSLDNYFIPRDGDVQSYLDHIQQFPTFDKPEAFGQHSNADIASLIGETRLLFETLLSMQVESSASVGESKEVKVLRLARDISQSTPNELNYEQTAKLIGLNRTPLQVVLLQEMERYNVLLRHIKVQLRDLQMGIRGLVVMSTELEDIYQAVYEGRVPQVWLKCYQSEKPLASWSRDLVLRIEHFAQWAKVLRPPTLFWLAAYTFPTGFITAVLQTSARASHTPIDELGWEFHIFVEEDDAAARIVREGGGVYVRGMFLEGAGWRRKGQCLTDPLPMELVSPMPVVHFKPVPQTKRRTRGVYSCPTYYYPQRAGSFVIAVDLKSGTENADYWIKRGTALLLSLSN